MKLNIVPARTGLTWVRLGLKTFLRQPLALAGLFFMYMSVVLVISMVPLIGPVIGGLLVPAATLGLMAATAEAGKGKFPMPWVLLSAFRAGRQQARSMLILGGLYTLGSMLATALATLIAPPMAASPGDPPVDAGLVIALLLHTPLFMLFWFAPALVHWHGITPAKSLFFSLVACLRNFMPLLVYGMTWLAVFIAVGTAFGVVGTLVGGAVLAKSVMMPIALLLAAAFSTSMYFTFRDSFLAEGPRAGSPDSNPSSGESP